MAKNRNGDEITRYMGDQRATVSHSPAMSGLEPLILSGCLTRAHSQAQRLSTVERPLPGGRESKKRGTCALPMTLNAAPLSLRPN